MRRGVFAFHLLLSLLAGYCYLCHIDATTSFCRRNTVKAERWDNQMETTTVRTTLKCVKTLLRCCSLIDDLNVTNAVLPKCTHKHTPYIYKYTYPIRCQLLFLSSDLDQYVAHWQQQLHEQDKWTHQPKQNSKANTVSWCVCLLAARFRWPQTMLLCRQLCAANFFLFFFFVVDYGWWHCAFTLRI